MTSEADFGYTLIFNSHEEGQLRRVIIVDTVKAEIILVKTGHWHFSFGPYDKYRISVGAPDV
jgi:hypothetical protein